MKGIKFYICKHCKNVAVKAVDSGVNIKCCGEDMAELSANTTDAAKEKHVPEVKVENSKAYVKVGSIPHPMTEEHHIAFIALVQNDKLQLEYLPHTIEAKAVFDIGNEPFKVYEYCNLHGLWVC